MKVCSMNVDLNKIKCVYSKGYEIQVVVVINMSIIE